MEDRKCECTEVKDRSNNRMHVNERHRALFPMSDGLSCANRLYVFLCLYSASRQ